MEGYFAEWPLEDWRPHIEDDLRTGEFEIMKIIEMHWNTVTVVDEQRFRSSVFLQGDGKWKCLRCQRYRCEHAKWVISQKIVPPGIPPSTPDEIDDILTY